MEKFQIQTLISLDDKQKKAEYNITKKTNKCILKENTKSM